MSRPTFSYSQSRHLAVGAMVTVRRWRDNEYVTLGLALKQFNGYDADMSVRVGPTEARQLATDLIAAAESLESSA